MTEDQAIQMGSICGSMLKDPDFNTIVSICETNLAQEMLASETAEARELVHRKYQGLKEIIDMMKQFVAVKDQIVSEKEREQD